MRLNRVTWLGLALVAVAQVATGCGSSSDSSGPARGAERGACYGNGTCNAGLRCLSNLCVVDGSDAAGAAGEAAGGSATQIGSAGANEGGAGGLSAAAGEGGAAIAASAGQGGEGGASVAGPCDPVLQTGCAASQRCTWIYGADPGVGAVGCVPQGTLSVGAACTTPTTGNDDCKSGSACVGGTCEPICDPDGVKGTCPSTRYCAVYDGVFADSGATPSAGLCDPTCDPVTQKRNTDGAAACGSPNPSVPTRGCYGTPGGAFTCAPAGTASNTSDVAISGTVYLNSCAPGFGALFYASSASQVPICTAFCKPAATSSSATAGAKGEPASSYTCPDRGANGTHECRFLQSLETTPDANGNTVGYCFDYTKYTYTPSGGGQDLTEPSCITLSPTAHNFDAMQTDAQYWGCQPLP
jgi:hypothetical protein